MVAYIAVPLRHEWSKVLAPGNRHGFITIIGEMLGGLNTGSVGVGCRGQGEYGPSAPGGTVALRELVFRARQDLYALQDIDEYAGRRCQGGSHGSECLLAARSGQISESWAQDLGSMKSVIQVCIPQASSRYRRPSQPVPIIVCVIHCLTQHAVNRLCHSAAIMPRIVERLLPKLLH